MPQGQHVVSLIGGTRGHQIGRVGRGVADAIRLLSGQLEPLRQRQPLEGGLLVRQVVGEQAQIELGALGLLGGQGAAAQRPRRGRGRQRARGVEEGEPHAALHGRALLVRVLLEQLLVVAGQLDVEGADGRRAEVGLEGRALGVSEEDEAAEDWRLVQVFHLRVSSNIF